MKVLFAVSNSNITDSVVSRYQQKYKEIITSKNVYYFNAIINELQKDKSYDSIVISEDLEPISNNNYEAIDKFIIEKMDRISDEASKLTGEDIPIIFICSDRRSNNDKLLRTLFSMSIYNALVGNDRSVNNVCDLINKPRNKKEAKKYYQIESDNDVVDYVSQNDKDELVSETQMQNILSYYKKIGNNDKKCVEAFERISQQYDQTQLRVIVKMLPMSVKAILEEKSVPYQRLMTGGTVLSNGSDSRYNSQQGTKLDFLEKDLEKSKLTAPVVIPESININRANNPQGMNRNNYQNQNNYNQPSFNNNMASSIYSSNDDNQQTNNMQSINNRNNSFSQNDNRNQNSFVQTPYMQSSFSQQGFENSNSMENVNKEQNNNPYFSNMKPNSSNTLINQNDLNNSMNQNQASHNFDVNPNKLNTSTENNNIESKLNEEDVAEPVKRGRGRPRKVKPVETVTAVKRGRGRPRKVTEESTNDISSAEQTNQLNNNQQTIDQMFQTPNNMNVVQNTQSVTNNNSLNHTNNLNENVNGTNNNSYEQIAIGNNQFGSEEKNDNQNSLNETRNNQYNQRLNNNTNLYGSMNKINNNNFENMNSYSTLENNNNNPYNPINNNPYNQANPYSQMPSMNNQFNNITRNNGQFWVEQTNNLYNNQRQMNNLVNNSSFYGGQSNNNELLNNNQTQQNSATNIMPNTSNGKIVSFVGTTKNGTSFIVNNLAQYLSQNNIRVAILDVTKNKNDYYMFTNNDPKLMQIASTSMKDLEIGNSNGIVVNNNLVVFTSLPEDANFVDSNKVIKTLQNNFDICLIDCDFETDVNYFIQSNEIYMVQTMDAFTIQPLTKFLSNLKSRNILDERKLRVIINKYVKLKKLDYRLIIGGMSKYNEPSMTLQRDLFNPDKIQTVIVPFDIQNYEKYLEEIAMCQLSLTGFTQDFVSALENLKQLVFPQMPNNNFPNNNGKKMYGNYDKKEKHHKMSFFAKKEKKENNENNNNYEMPQFSNDMNSTLDKMRNNF